MASGKRAIYAAIAGNFAIAVTKFVAAGITGSSAMLTEGIHSLVDTGNGGLLLLGIKRSRRQPSRMHPFGYGKDVYFYTLIVAILIFGAGGGISIYEGILHSLHPGELRNPTINYVVLGIAILFEASVWLIAIKEFRAIRGDRSFWDEVRETKDPTTFTVLFEDTAALLGLLIALVGIFLAHRLEMPVLDGIASIGIGLVLCGVASLLIMESKGLLLGESVDPKVRESVQRLADTDPDIVEVHRLMSMHIGPEVVLLNMDLVFRADLTTDEIERVVDRIEKAVRTEHRNIRFVTIEAASLEPPAQPAD